MAARQKRLLTKLAGATAILAFLIISSAAVVWANGLRYSSATGSFEQTVLIAVNGSTPEVGVWLNGKKVSDRIPYHVRNLLPGHYVVELTKNGYQTWRQSFWLSKGQIGLIDDPTLIALKPLTVSAELPIATGKLDRLDFGLQLSDGELTDNGELITRFSQTPLQIHRFNDFYLYQVGGELRLFQSRTSQDFPFYRSANSALLPLTLFQSTRQVEVVDGTDAWLVSLTSATP